MGCRRRRGGSGSRVTIERLALPPGALQPRAGLKRGIKESWRIYDSVPMTDAVVAARIQFAFTLMFHYLFPITTMGLAPLIVVLKTLHLLRRDETYAVAARFWTRIFALNFAVGVITGIPMEFQFGTNWAVFSAFAGGIIGQTLALESVFAFFLESSFLGVLLFAEGRVRPWVHWLSAVLVAAGAFL